MSLTEARKKLNGYKNVGVHFETTTLPGNSSVAISHGFFVPEVLRGKGIGREVNELRLKDMKNGQYDLAICTVNMDNAPELKIMDANGWHLLIEFNDQCNNSRVGLFGRTLEDIVE